MAEKSDEELMQGVARGEMAGLEALLTRYKDRMLGYLTRTVQDQALAEDLFQETFLRVYRSRESYRFPLKFSTWLYTIARNLCLNELEKKGVRKSVLLHAGREDMEGDGLALEETLAAPGPDPLALLQDEERRGMVVKAMGELPEEQRTVLHLTAYEEMGYEEIAGILGCTRGALKVRVHRAYR